jgi:hypothetical protein
VTRAITYAEAVAIARGEMALRIGRVSRLPTPVERARVEAERRAAEWKARRNGHKAQPAVR